MAHGSDQFMLPHYPLSSGCGACCWPEVQQHFDIWSANVVFVQSGIRIPQCRLVSVFLERVIRLCFINVTIRASHRLGSCSSARLGLDSGIGCWILAFDTT